MLSDIELLNESEINLKWFISNSSKIKDRFEGKVIAIWKEKIIASAGNTQELLKSIEKKGIDDSEVLIERIPRKNEITIL